jgi:hypothetical protein
MKFRFFYILFLLLTVFSCESTAESSDNEKLNSLQKKLLDVASLLEGKKTYSKEIVGGKEFTLDCIGTVSAIFYGIGIDITTDFNKYNGNGVSRLYNSLKDKNCVYKNRMPKVGDVIFWDNTWDKNGDGKPGNDELTHAGIVVKAEPDGNISYIHANYVFGIVVENMNLNDPATYKDESGKIINSILGLGASPSKHQPHWLSGDLFREYGIVLEN